jgi:hypothetical protein
MNPQHLHLGAVFQPDWDERPIRVLAFDKTEVMYDCWWPHKGAWGLTSLKGTVSYYRIATTFLLSRAAYVRTDQYTDSEFKIHRPDLPFSFAKCSEIEWSVVLPASINELEQSLASTKISAAILLASLNAPRLYLSPFGPKGSSKPGHLVEAQNGEAFSAAELLWHASRLQAPFVRDVPLTTGVGIYRLGLQRQLPSYYIWGARSRAAYDHAV